MFLTIICPFLQKLFMAITSIMGIWSNFFAFSILSMIIHFYTFLFGILTCLLEGKEYALPTSYESMIEKYAMFLQFVWGRGCVYFFAGSLQFCQYKLLDIISGSFMCFVGIMYIIVGRSTAKKLLELRHSVFTEETTRKLFEEVDAQKIGALNLELFTIFMEKLGVDLKKNEIVTAFSLIDKDNSGKVTFDEFILWWNEFESNADSLRDAQWIV